MSATQWAATVPEGSAVRWKALEVAAFAGHRKVVALLDPKRKYGRPKGGALDAVKSVLLVFWAFIMLVVFAFPSGVGIVLLLGSIFSLQTTSQPVGLGFGLPAAGIAFLWSIVVQIAFVVDWAKNGRDRRGAFAAQPFFAVVFGVWSLVIVGTQEASEVGGAWAFWVAAIVVSTVVGVVCAVIYLVGARRKAAEAESLSGAGRAKGTGRRSAVEPLKPVRLAVEKLPQSDRDAVRRDLDSAIDTLTSRGIITEADAAWAHSAELGKLALHMSSPRPRR